MRDLSAFLFPKMPYSTILSIPGLPGTRQKDRAGGKNHGKGRNSGNDEQKQADAVQNGDLNIDLYGFLSSFCRVNQGAAADGLEKKKPAND